MGQIVFSPLDSLLRSEETLKWSHFHRKTENQTSVRMCAQETFSLLVNSVLYLPSSLCCLLVLFWKDLPHVNRADHVSAQIQFYSCWSDTFRTTSVFIMNLSLYWCFHFACWWRCGRVCRGSDLNRGLLCELGQEMCLCEDTVWRLRTFIPACFYLHDISPWHVNAP